MRLAERPVRSIVAAVADAAARWRDADFPPRVRLLPAICERTGYSLPVVEYALDRLFASLDATQLSSAIVRELGPLDLLDGFVAEAGRQMRALPVGRVCIVSSRTTVGVAIVPAVFALCAKCEVVVKDREDALVAAFFETVAQELGSHAGFQARAWDGARERHAFDGCAAVVAFGDDASLTAIRVQIPPASRFIAFPNKASCGYVAREALATTGAARTIAEGAARDLVLYDTEGCLSLHALFVERGGSVEPAAFVELLAASVERAGVEFPIGPRDAQRWARTAAARDLAVFRASDGRAASFSDRDAGFVVTLDPPLDRPPPFAPRALAAFGVDGPDEAITYLRHNAIPIEALAAAGPREPMQRLAVALGAARIAPFGCLQAPPARQPHGGRPRIAEFVRWVADDT